MNEILIKAGCYIAIIVLGQVLRRTGFFGREIDLGILAFSPIGSAVPGFTAELKGDVGLSSAVNSISILCSIVIIVTLLLVIL